MEMVFYIIYNIYEYYLQSMKLYTCKILVLIRIRSIIFFSFIGKKRFNISSKYFFYMYPLFLEYEKRQQNECKILNTLYGKDYILEKKILKIANPI